MDHVLRQWDLAAEAYRKDQQQNPNARRNRLLVEQRFPDLTGREVLDAGCGFGDYTDYFCRAGARAVGCDGSVEMLSLARSYYPDCEFCAADLLEPLPFADGRFDLIFCNQVLMDLPEIDGVFREFSRVLREGGILYLALVHPASYPAQWVEDAQGVKMGKILRDYGRVYPLKHRYCGGTTHFHRPISHYLNLAAENEFCLTHMDEPWEKTERDHSAIPPFLIVEFRKLPNASAR